MDARVQRRVQRYGWDLAATDYETLWRRQLSGVQAELLGRAALREGERVLDVACGTGCIAIAAACAVGAAGRVYGVDLSGEMLGSARRLAQGRAAESLAFTRMDAEALTFDAASFDVVLCSLGLMYFPDPEQALHEMQRVLRPGGRLVVAVWGERGRCGWSDVFEIVQREVSSTVCPLFFWLGGAGVLASLCRGSGWLDVEQHVITTTLDYADADEASRAAFVGGPVALAWSRFDAAARARATDRYVDSIQAWKTADGFRLPAEFIIVSAIGA